MYASRHMNPHHGCNIRWSHSARNVRFAALSKEPIPTAIEARSLLSALSANRKKAQHTQAPAAPATPPDVELEPRSRQPTASSSPSDTQAPLGPDSSSLRIPRPASQYASASRFSSPRVGEAGPETAVAMPRASTGSSAWRSREERADPVSTSNSNRSSNGSSSSRSWQAVDDGRRAVTQPAFAARPPPPPRGDGDGGQSSARDWTDRQQDVARNSTSHAHSTQPPNRSNNESSSVSAATTKQQPARTAAPAPASIPPDPWLITANTRDIDVGSSSSNVRASPTSPARSSSNRSSSSSGSSSHNDRPSQRASPALQQQSAGSRVPTSGRDSSSPVLTRGRSSSVLRNSTTTGTRDSVDDIDVMERAWTPLWQSNSGPALAASWSAAPDTEVGVPEGASRAAARTAQQQEPQSRNEAPRQSPVQQLQKSVQQSPTRAVQNEPTDVIAGSRVTPAASPLTPAAARNAKLSFVDLLQALQQDNAGEQSQAPTSSTRARTLPPQQQQQAARSRDWDSLRELAGVAGDTKPPVTAASAAAPTSPLAVAAAPAPVAASKAAIPPPVSADFKRASPAAASDAGLAQPASAALAAHDEVSAPSTSRNPSTVASAAAVPAQPTAPAIATKEPSPKPALSFSVKSAFADAFLASADATGAPARLPPPPVAASHTTSKSFSRPPSPPATVAPYATRSSSSSSSSDSRAAAAPAAMSGSGRAPVSSAAAGGATSGSGRIDADLSVGLPPRAKPHSDSVGPVSAKPMSAVGGIGLQRDSGANGWQTSTAKAASNNAHSSSSSSSAVSSSSSARSDRWDSSGDGDVTLGSSISSSVRSNSARSDLVASSSNSGSDSSRSSVRAQSPAPPTFKASPLAMLRQLSRSGDLDPAASASLRSAAVLSPRGVRRVSEPASPLQDDAPQGGPPRESNSQLRTPQRELASHPPASAQPAAKPSGNDLYVRGTPSSYSRGQPGAAANSRGGGVQDEGMSRVRGVQGDASGANRGGQGAAPSRGQQLSEGVRAMMSRPKSSGFQCHFPAPTPGLPVLAETIIVEGITDCRAVQRAVNAPVFVCHGDGVHNPAIMAEVDQLRQRAAAGGGRLIILTDTDLEGRMLRKLLDERLGRVMHAFIPVDQATSTTANDRHEVGNVGVEHAAPDAIRRALQQPRQSYGTQRTEFTREEMLTRLLMNDWDAVKKMTPVELNVAVQRRVLLSLQLGVDCTTGKAMLTLLNSYFSRQDFDRAMQRVDELHQAMVAHEEQQRQQQQ